MDEKLDIDDIVFTRDHLREGLYEIKHTNPLMGLNVFTKFLDCLSLNNCKKLTNEEYILLKDMDEKELLLNLRYKYPEIYI